jgi:hypothetical protein
MQLVDAVEQPVRPGTVRTIDARRLLGVGRLLRVGRLLGDCRGPLLWRGREVGCHETAMIVHDATPGAVDVVKTQAP